MDKEFFPKFASSKLLIKEFIEKIDFPPAEKKEFFEGSIIKMIDTSGSTSKYKMTQSKFKHNFNNLLIDTSGSMMNSYDPTDSIFEAELAKKEAWKLDPSHPISLILLNNLMTKLNASDAKCEIAVIDNGKNVGSFVNLAPASVEPLYTLTYRCEVTDSYGYAGNPPQTYTTSKCLMLTRNIVHDLVLTKHNETYYTLTVPTP